MRLSMQYRTGQVGRQKLLHCANLQMQWISCTRSMTVSPMTTNSNIFVSMWYDLSCQPRLLSNKAALFTSDGLGFGHGSGGGLSALPLAGGCVSPFSDALLWFYGHTLDYGGPSYALRTHTLICGAFQIISGWALRAYDNRLQRATNNDEETFSAHAITSVSNKSRLLLFVLFIFQNGYVQLLYNQHWAFISSVLTPEEGARLFALPQAPSQHCGDVQMRALLSCWTDLLEWPHGPSQIFDPMQ